jgi:hypothetical protein
VYCILANVWQTLTKHESDDGDVTEDLLLAVWCLRNDLHPVSHQVHGVEAYTKLANKVDVSTLLHLLQESTRAWRQAAAAAVVEKEACSSKQQLACSLQRQRCLKVTEQGRKGTERSAVA